MLIFLGVIAAIILILLLGVFGAGVGALVIGAVLALGWLAILLIPAAITVVLALVWCIWWCFDRPGARAALREAEQHRANEVRRRATLP